MFLVNTGLSHGPLEDPACSEDLVIGKMPKGFGGVLRLQFLGVFSRKEMLKSVFRKPCYSFSVLINSFLIQRKKNTKLYYIFIVTNNVVKIEIQLRIWRGSQDLKT